MATGLGAASSSCSYAAVALARAPFRRGASFTAVMAFEIASTNLVIELGIIMALLLSWQFALAEFTGGPIMIVLMAVAFRLFVRQRLINAAREQADKGLAGSMEGHAAMDMSIQSSGSFWRRLASRDGYTSVSQIFVMEWAAVIRDIGGLLIAGAVGAWVPDTFWQHLFLTGHPLAAKLWGPVIGPVISVLSFVCSIGNVPLAAVLWNGGISFGGVIAFIFADLIIIPILVIYRKYYGTKMMLAILGIFYATMVLAGYIIEFFFSGLGLIPANRAAKVTETVTVELHHHPQHHLLAGGRRAAGAVLPFRRRPDAQDDGRQPRRHEHHAHPEPESHPHTGSPATPGRHGSELRQPGQLFAPAAAVAPGCPGAGGTRRRRSPRANRSGSTCSALGDADAWPGSPGCGGKGPGPASAVVADDVVVMLLSLLAGGVR